jgi:hypothetical protein
MKKQNIRLVCSVIAAIFFSFYSQARTDAEIKTYKFSVDSSYGKYDYELHLPLDDESFTNRVVKILSENTQKLAEYFQYAPKEVIHFNLSEYDHESNGSATVFPIDQIVLRKFPPIGAEHLSISDDYLKGLVLHELIHIIHMDQTGGFPKFIETIFGSVGKFGGIVPRWFVEGVATWGESEFTNGGRLRNKLMRLQWEEAMGQDDFCRSIDCIDNPGVYPYRQFPYWTGAYFLEYLESRKKGTVRCLVTANNNNIPFFLNSAFEECLNKSATRLFGEFRNLTRTKLLSRNEEDLSPVPNAINTKDLSAGIILVGNDLISAEGDNKVRKVVSQNIENFSFNEIDISGRLSSIGKYSSDASVITSFDNQRDKTPRSTEILKSNKLENIDSDSDYSFFINNERVTFKFDSKKWSINNGKYLFSRNVTISDLKKSKNGIFFKLFDARELNTKLAFYSPSANKVSIVKKYKRYFQILETCSDEALVRSKNNIYLISSNSETELTKSYLNRALLLSSNEKKSAIVLESSKSSLYIWNKGCSDFLKMKKKFKRIKSKKYVNKESNIEINNAAVKEKSYPAFNHFLPNYWFFDYTGETDSLSAWGLRTTLTDPDQRHTLDLRMVYYSELSEYAPDISYTYEFPFFHYLNITHQKTYSNSTLRKGNDSTELTLLSYSKKFELKHFDFLASAYGANQKIDDFLSVRNEKEYGALLKFKKLRTQFDDFWQELSLKARVFKKDVETYEGYGGVQSILKLNTNPFKYFYIFGDVSYSSLDKSTFKNGVLYGGGNYTEYHQFYGISYSDIFGNELKSTRGGIRVSVLDIYRGAGLIPIFLEELHLKGGTDYIAADKIIIGNQVLSNKSAQSWWGGFQLDLTFAYAVPISIEVIKSVVNNKYGEDIDSTSTVISGGLSF